MTDIRVGAAAVKVLRRANSTTQKLLAGQVAVKVLRAYLAEEEPPPEDQEEPTTPFTGQIWPRSEELGGDGEWVPGSLPDGESNPGSFGTWQALTGMPVVRSWAGGGVINGKLYVAGGLSATSQSNSTATLYCYDPATNLWSTKAPMPAERAQFAASGVINGKLYVVGGLGPAGLQTLQNTTYCYDPASNTWSTKAPMPAALRWGARGNAVIGNKMYVIGGQDGASQYFDTVYCYDASTNSWSTKAPLPTPVAFSMVSALGGKLYVVGGQDPAGGRVKTLCYDPSTDTWTLKANMIDTSLNKMGFAAGGRIVVTATSDVRSYNPETDSWSYNSISGTPANIDATVGGVVTDLTTGQDRLLIASGIQGTTPQGSTYALVTPDYAHGSITSFGTAWSSAPDLPISLTRFGTFVLDKVIYVCGGRTSGGNASRRVFALDTKLTNPAWVEKSKLPAARMDVYSAKVNRQGFIIGGKNANGDDVRTVYKYNPKADKWTAKALMPSARSSKGVSSHKCGSGDKIYIAGGERDGKRKKTLYIYNPAKDRWTSGPEMPVSVSGNVIVVQGARGKVYSVSGSKSSGDASLYVYDIDAKEWTTLVDPGAAQPSGSYACVGAGKIILSGAGPNPAGTPTMRFYDIATNVWSTGTLPNNPANGRGSAFVVSRGRLYLIGGSSWSNGDTTRATKSVYTIPVPFGDDEEFVPSDSIGQLWPRENVLPPAGHWAVTPDSPDESGYGAQWSSIQTVPGRSGHAMVVTEDGYPYIFGGSAANGNNGDVITVYRYDPSSNTWTRKADMPEARDRFSGAALINGKVYLAGGKNSSGVAQNQTWCYDIATDTWSVKANMPFAHYHSYSAGDSAAGGKLWVIGGTKSVGFTLSAETWCYDPTTNAWARMHDLPIAMDHNLVVAVGRRVYTIGGSSGSLTTWSRTSYYYDLDLDNYVSIPDLPSAPTGTFTWQNGVGAAAGEGGGRLHVAMNDAQLHVFVESSSSWQTIAVAGSSQVGSRSAIAGSNSVLYEQGALPASSAASKLSIEDHSVSSESEPIFVEDPPSGLIWA